MPEKYGTQTSTTTRPDGSTKVNTLKRPDGSTVKVTKPSDFTTPTPNPTPSPRQ